MNRDVIRNDFVGKTIVEIDTTSCNMLKFHFSDKTHIDLYAECGSDEYSIPYFFVEDKQIEKKLDNNFFYLCRSSIKQMKEAGMNNTIIGWILYTIRASAIREERLRQEIIINNNPPDFSITGFDIADQIKNES